MASIGCNEFFSGFENIGHNDPLSLLFLWIIPKWVARSTPLLPFKERS